ncbi:hypothetical protein KKD04_02375 [Patescibacteria group bacterium]|nr:hypothetical protein [Patescibacteria group bacterium]
MALIHLFAYPEVFKESWLCLGPKEKEKYFTSKDMSEYDWLKNQLNIITGWMKDKRFIRVDPYNLDKVLDGEGSEEDVK